MRCALRCCWRRPWRQPAIPVGIIGRIDFLMFIQDALQAEASKSKSGVCRSAPCAVCFAAGEHLRRSRTSRVAMRLSDRGTWFVRSARPSPARYRSSPTLGIRRHLAPDVRSRLTCGEEPIGTRDEGLGISERLRSHHPSSLIASSRGPRDRRVRKPRP